MDSTGGSVSVSFSSFVSVFPGSTGCSEAGSGSTFSVMISSTTSSSATSD